MGSPGNRLFDLLAEEMLADEVADAVASGEHALRAFEIAFEITVSDRRGADALRREIEAARASHALKVEALRELDARVAREAAAGKGGPYR